MAVPGTSPIASELDLLTVVFDQMGQLTGLDPAIAPDLFSPPSPGVRNLPPGENLASELDQLFTDHGFHFQNSYSENWLGQGERWFMDRNAAWYFITPAGGLYRWNGGSFAGSTKLVDLDPVAWSDPTRLFHLPAQMSESDDLQLGQLQQQYGFHFQGSYYQNWLGHDEKWFADRAGNWNFVTPTGQIYRWNGDNFAGSTYLASVSTDVATDPSLLLRTPPELSPTDTAQLTALQAQYGFHFQGSYYQNWSGLGEKWFADRAGNWFYMTPGGQIFASGNNTPVTTVNPIVFADLTALFHTSPLAATGTGQVAAAQSGHNFQFVGSYFENWLGQNEKWVQDGTGAWYFVTPAGQIYRWNGGDFAGSTFVQQVDPVVYTDPSLLWQSTTTLTLSQGAAPLTQSQLNSIVSAAEQRWLATGLDAGQQNALQNLTFTVGSLGGGALGVFSNNQIIIDANAAGEGWFVDATPLDDVEFSNQLSSSRRTAEPFTAAGAHIDLLTTVMHEIGHGLGLADKVTPADRENVMYAYLNVGERRLPQAGQAAGAVPGSITTENLLTEPTVTLLPAGKEVCIFYQVVVNDPIPAGVTEVCSQGTFSGNTGGRIQVEAVESPDAVESPGGNTFSVVTDDPDTPAVNDETCTPVVEVSTQKHRSLWDPH
jgi:hypothetical protein